MVHVYALVSWPRTRLHHTHKITVHPPSPATPAPRPFLTPTLSNSREMKTSQIPLRTRDGDSFCSRRGAAFQVATISTSSPLRHHRHHIRMAAWAAVGSLECLFIFFRSLPHPRHPRVGEIQSTITDPELRRPGDPAKSWPGCMRRNKGKSRGICETEGHIFLGSDHILMRIDSGFFRIIL
jgi:hypothetical protein